MTFGDLDRPLEAVPTIALCGGLALYFLTHVVQRVRIAYLIRRTGTDAPGWIGPGRLAAGIAMLLLIPAAMRLSALASLALATLICWSLIAWDMIHYRGHRAEVRRDRP